MSHRHETTCAAILALWVGGNCVNMNCAGQAGPALKEVFKNDFLIGAALNPTQFAGAEAGNCEVALIKKHFNTITPENVLKWALVHPWLGSYDFGPADRYVEFGVKNKMFIVGHNLVWHNQTPDWVFRDALGGPVPRDALLQRMRDHIFTVVGRYKGKIRGWDVVNEAVDEDGSLRKTPWMKIIGEDYLLKAYQFAHEADPAAELYYNDFSMESPAKRAGAIEVLKKLLASGAPVAGVGMQGHYTMTWPTAQAVEDTINAFSDLGLKVMITELDIDVLPGPTWNPANAARENPYTNGLPDKVQQALADRYAELFKVFVKHRKQIARVTFWGVTDGDSWLNYMPVQGRTDYPLLFGRGCEPKPAFFAVVRQAKDGR